MFSIIKSIFNKVDNPCHDCDQEIQPFTVSNKHYLEVVGDFKTRLCFNCFCKRSKEKGLKYMYKLINVHTD